MTSPSHDAETASTHAHREWRWPLRFRAHDFLVHCFETYGCRVRYDGRLEIDEDAEVLSPPTSRYGADYQDRWLGGDLGIKNFPSPAKVEWRSKDGVAHAAEVDISAIFHDQLIRHRMRQDEIPDDAVIMDPLIILEVNDRTINVYMRASLPTKVEQIPGNRFSKWRRDVILAHTQHY